MGEGGGREEKERETRKPPPKKKILQGKRTEEKLCKEKKSHVSAKNEIIHRQ